MFLLSKVITIKTLRAKVYFTLTERVSCITLFDTSAAGCVCIKKSKIFEKKI